MKIYSQEKRIGKRLLDIVLSGISIAILVLPALFISLLIKLTSRGPCLHWSPRIGRDNIGFLMPKFRTMKLETPLVATHLLVNSSDYVTPVGRVLRLASLDEIPQIWCVLKGEMSFVGPRPALFNQEDLISERTTRGIHKLLPGITGLAQIKGRDELPIPLKVEYDYEYLTKSSLLFDLKIIFLTLYKVIRVEGISH